jgi:hypothetical protein
MPEARTPRRGGTVAPLAGKTGHANRRNKGTGRVWGERDSLKTHHVRWAPSEVPTTLRAPQVSPMAIRSAIGIAHRKYTQGTPEVYR